MDSLRNELFSVTLVSAINKSGARVRLHYDRYAELTKIIDELEYEVI